MKNEKISKALMETPTIRNLGIKEEIVDSIINSYNDILLKVLLDSGFVNLDNGMHIEIVKLTERVHVLRGVTYQSNRKYKLKLTMEEELYKKIEDYYDRLQEEIE